VKSGEERKNDFNRSSCRGCFFFPKGREKFPKLRTLPQFAGLVVLEWL